MLINILPIAFCCVVNPHFNTNDNYKRFNSVYQFETLPAQVNLTSSYYLTNPLRDTLETNFTFTLGGSVYFNDAEDWLISFENASLIASYNGYAVNKGSIFKDTTDDSDTMLYVETIEFLHSADFYLDEFHLDDVVIRGENDFIRMSALSSDFSAIFISNFYFEFYNQFDEAFIIEDEVNVTDMLDSFDNSKTLGQTSFTYTLEFDIDTFYLPITQYVNRDLNDYNLGYQDGYNIGRDFGYQLGLDESFDIGYATGYRYGYDLGHYDGFNEGATQDELAFTIFNGFLNVAMVPVNFFLAIFNFEILGINVKSIVSALLTLSVIIIVIRLITGKRSD